MPTHGYGVGFRADRFTQQIKRAAYGSSLPS
jgi:hypothetical protein